MRIRSVGCSAPSLGLLAALELVATPGGMRRVASPETLIMATQSRGRRPGGEIPSASPLSGSSTTSAAPRSPPDMGSTLHVPEASSQTRAQQAIGVNSIPPASSWAGDHFFFPVL